MVYPSPITSLIIGVQTWYEATLRNFALPSGLCRLAITGFATKAYAAPVHHDPRDAKWTAGIRCWRGRNEPDSAYQFVYPTLKAEGCKVGIIVEQPSEAVMIW
jgi:hypothetical protein